MSREHSERVTWKCLSRKGLKQRTVISESLKSEQVFLVQVQQEAELNLNKSEGEKEAVRPRRETDQIICSCVKMLDFILSEMGQHKAL